MKDVVNRLKELNYHIATMESCTGGGVANAITNIPGASEVLLFSAVTYSNEYKIKMGVSADTIDKYSVNKDGKTLYQKTINCGTMTSREMSVAHNISNIENVIDLCGIYTMPNEFLVVPYSSQAGNTWNIRLSATSTNIILTFGSSFSVQGTTCVTIKYTKTTDIAPNSNN